MTVCTPMVQVCLWICSLFTEEEAAEVKKSKLYRPATKFVPVPQNVLPASSAESKKSVSLYSTGVFLWWLVGELTANANVLVIYSEHYCLFWSVQLYEIM